MDKEQFVEKLRQTLQPVVVDIWAPWCMPCRVIEPALDHLKMDYAGRVDVWKVNADEEGKLVQSLGVSGIPTLIAFHQAQEIGRLIGVQPQAVLEDLFKAALDGAPVSGRSRAAADRYLRLFAGTALLILGFYTGPSWLLVAAAGVVLFSAVYDRCPIWQAVTSRLKRLLQPSTSSGQQT